MKELNAKDVSLPRISASKIKVYESCPEQYLAKYVLHLPQTLTTYGLVGSAIHKAIEAAYLNNAFPYDTAAEYIKHEFATTFSGNDFIGWGETEAINKAWKMLDNVPYDDYSPRVIEQEFLVPFPFDNPICNLHGFIDMVTTDGKIIDWKSQSKVPTKKESATQLAIYYYAYMMLYEDAPEEVFIFHLPSSKKVTLPTMQLLEKLGELKSTIQDMITLVNTFDMLAADVQPCNGCNNIFCPLNNINNPKSVAQ